MKADDAKTGENLRLQGDFVGAIECFTRAIQTTTGEQAGGNERLAWLYAHRGSARSEIGMLEEALEDFKLAIDRRWDYPWARAHWGEAYRIQARDLYTTKKDEPQFAVAIVNAFKSLQEALASEPDYAWAHAHLGASGVLCYWFYELYLAKRIPEEVKHAFTGDSDLSFGENISQQFHQARTQQPGNSWTESFDAIWSTIANDFAKAEALAGAAVFAGADVFPLQRALALTALYTARAGDPEGTAERTALRRANELLKKDPEEATSHLVRAAIYKQYPDDPTRKAAFEYSTSVLRTLSLRLDQYLKYLEDGEGVIGATPIDLETHFILSRLMPR